MSFSHRSRLGLVGLGFALVTGCGAAPEGGDGEDEVGQVEQPIAGGYKDQTDTAVVGIFNQSLGMCSGSLLAPNMVLTARHCVSRTQNEVNGGIDCSQTTFGTPQSADGMYVTTNEFFTQYESDYHRVREVVTLPTDNSFCGQDQAILILEDNIEAIEAIPLIPRVDVPLVKSEQYYAVGYGATSDAGSGAGTRRRRDELYIKCVGEECPSWSGTAPTEWTGDRGICEGDSGGPALDLQNRVVGVTSRGISGCEEPIYGYVYGWAQWIKDTATYAAQLGGYPAPGWASGWPTDPAYSAPIGAACATAEECPSNACLNGYCTRLCIDTAPCPEGYQCDANLGGVCAQIAPPVTDPPITDPGTDPPDTSHPDKNKADADEADVSEGGCALAPEADPTKPIPWFTSLLAVGAVVNLGRRRSRKSTRR